MIISASRKTDIPAYFSEWFINRIREGYVITRNPNPASRQLYRINLSPDIVDCIVFWTKNPAPMIDRLDELSDYQYYFQFTLTGYDKDIERNLPPKEELIETFQKLSEKIGKKRVIWRYDPILLSNKYDMCYHLDALGKIATALKGYTEKCVFSFIDPYAAIWPALSSLKISIPNEEEMYNLARTVRMVTHSCDMTAATCAEKFDLNSLGIKHNCCIDKDLIECLTGYPVKNTKKNLKDKGQREICGCMASRDIGAYNTCRNGCIYCYANTKMMDALYDPLSPILCDQIGPYETVKDMADQKSVLVK